MERHNWWRGTIAQNSAAAANMMFGPPSHALASLLVVCLLRACKNFSVLRGEILFGRAIQFLLLVEQPVNTCNAVCEINHWHRLFHIFLQHRLIGVAKTQGNSQGSAPVFSPTSSGFCSHPRPALNSTFCELPHVGVWETL